MTRTHAPGRPLAVVTTPSRDDGADARRASFENELDGTLESSFASYRRALWRRALRDAFRPRRRYVDFLRHMVLHARHVAHVIEAAAQALAGRPAAQEAFRSHGEEERGHDALARADLEALGESEAWEPTPAFLALEGYTRNLARERPLGVLGFLVMAEGLAARFGARWLRVLGWLGFGAESTRFLSLHVGVDAEHFPKLRRLCLEHAESRADQVAILQAIRVTSDLMARA